MHLTIARVGVVLPVLLSVTACGGYESRATGLAEECVQTYSKLQNYAAIDDVSVQIRDMPVSAADEKNDIEWHASGMVTYSLKDNPQRDWQTATVPFRWEAREGKMSANGSFRSGEFRGGPCAKEP